MGEGAHTVRLRVVLQISRVYPDMFDLIEPRFVHAVKDLKKCVYNRTAYLPACGEMVQL